MKIGIKILSAILFLLVQSAFSQVQLETVYVSKKKVSTTTTEVRYYYYPNLEAYFDTCDKLYIYKHNGEWISTAYLSPSYRGYSLNNTHFVLLPGLIEDQPHQFISEHKIKYPANFSSKRKRDIATIQH
jgi:hypothetical protein